MGYGEIFETTNQNGERIRVRDELPDTTAEIDAFRFRSQEICARLANLAITMNTYENWFKPTPQTPSLKPYSPFDSNQLPLQTVN